MDSNKHAEVLSMTVETDEGPRDFDYIYCEGYEINGIDPEIGFIIVLTSLSEPISVKEAKKLAKADKPCFGRMFCLRGFRPVPGAVDFLTSVCDKHHTTVIFDVFSVDSLRGEEDFDATIILSKWT